MIPRTLLTVICVVVSVGGAPSATADGKDKDRTRARSGSIIVEQVWVRATSINVTAAYATLRNTGGKPDRLLQVTSPAAARVEIHNIVEKNGMVSMVPMRGVDVSSGEPTVLRPSGLHIMLMGLRRRLVKGGAIQLTFTFRDAGAVTVRAAIAGRGARKAPSGTN